MIALKMTRKILGCGLYENTKSFLKLGEYFAYAANSKIDIKKSQFRV